MSQQITDNKQTLTQHLTELRTCLIRSLLSLIAGMVASLYFAKEIFHFLQEPLLRVLPEGSRFIATGPIEAFVTYLKVSLLTGVFISSPVILYHLWRFIAPGLYRKEKTIAFLFVSFTTLFFVGGAIFGYMVVFPVGFKFFVAALEGTEIAFLPQMKDYLGFISKMLLAFGAAFEMPVILVILARLGLVTRAGLSRARRYVLVLMFLVAGVLTPGPDVLSQFLLAVPLLALYEISILAVRIIK